SLPHGLREDFRSAVFELVAVHAGDHRVADAELLDRERGAARLVKIELRGTSRLHGAEAARAGADVAEDHERRRLAAPALGDVGAHRVLADGMKLPLPRHAKGR